MFLLISTYSHAQKAQISGSVFDLSSREVLGFANISIDDEVIVLSSDSTGLFFVELDPGYHKIKVSFLGYEARILHQVKADPIKPVFLEIGLSPDASMLEEITIPGEIINRTVETPLSIRTIGINEINRFPGTTLDLSKVIKNMPGVLPKVSFGYNIIVRGGASHENKFYIDGIEIPSINHFAVQGVSGGPNGLINVDLLSGADLITGAFPANRYNALSSVLNMRTRSARNDRLGGKFTLGATDVGLTLEGPLSPTSGFIASFRKSFSEYYLKAFKLPVLPYYSDYNFKFESKWKNKELKVIGIGGWDKSRLNTADASAPNASESLLYNVGYIPDGDQNVHTLGVNYRYYNSGGFTEMIFSNTRFLNKALKYFDNTYQEEDLWFDYNSSEANQEFRIENTIFRGGNQIKFGFSSERQYYSLNNYSREYTLDAGSYILDFDSELTFFNFGAYFSYSFNLLDDKLNVYTGIRTDASSFGLNTYNPFNQISPRLSLNYQINDNFDISGNIGSYYMLPPSNLLGFKQEDELVNRTSLGFINSRQAALGLNFRKDEDKVFTIESYYKQYRNYPFLLRDQISFANANADYVVVGNQPANSSSTGRTYGLELFGQKKFEDNSLWSVTYNFAVSEFQDKNGEYVPSSWDTRHFISLIWAKTFGKNWQIGLKFNYASSSPYTPFDVENSSVISYWDANRRGLFDFENLNSQYLKPYNAMDIRLDKNFYFKKWTMNLYLDVQNIYSASIENIPYLVPDRNQDGTFIIDSADPSRYQMKFLNSDTGRVLPTIGIIAEF